MDSSDNLDSESNGINYHELIGKTATLGSPPDVCQRIRSLLDKPGVAAEEVANLIGADPGLTAALLRIANSHAAANGIDNPLDAVRILGMEGVRGLIFAANANSAFPRIPADLVDMDDFWHHSLCCGLAAQALADRCEKTRMERPFFTGLLHDIGQLHIYEHMPTEARQVLEKAGAPEEYRYKAEKELVGFTHAQVGAQLMRQWKLPAHLCEPVEFHHEPERAGRYSVEAAIVHLATNIANAIEPSWKTERGVQRVARAINPSAWFLSGFTHDIIEPVLETVMDDSISVMEMISPGFLTVY